MGTLPSSRHAGLDMTEHLGKCLFGFGGHSQPTKLHHDSKSRAPWESYMGIDHNLYRIWGVNIQLHCQLFGRSPGYQGFDMFGHVSIRSFKSYVTLWCQSEASPDDHHILSTLLRTLWKLISSSGWSVCKTTLAPLGPHTLEIHAWRKVHQQPISKLYNVVGKPHQYYWIYLNLNLQMNLAKNGAPDCRWFVAFLIGSVYFHHKKSGWLSQGTDHIA